MAKRNNRVRRLARKERKAKEVATRAKADEAYAEERRLHPTTDFSRIHQILLNGRFRSHEKGGTKPFKDCVLGPTVKASNPAELEAATNAFYAREALKQVPS